MLDDPRYEATTVIANAEDGLRITWADGHESGWPLVDVRRACPCAVCNEQRANKQAVWPGSGAPRQLDVVDARVVGDYAIAFHWNDGHESGIFSWTRLRDSCPCAECQKARIRRAAEVAES